MTRISAGKSTFKSTPTLTPDELELLELEELDDELVDEEPLDEELADEEPEVEELLFSPWLPPHAVKITKHTINATVDNLFIMFPRKSCGATCC